MYKNLTLKQTSPTFVTNSSKNLIYKLLLFSVYTSPNQSSSQHYTAAITVQITYISITFTNFKPFIFVYAYQILTNFEFTIANTFLPCHPQLSSHKHAQRRLFRYAYPQTFQIQGFYYILLFLIYIFPSRPVVVPLTIW